jgi:hypothetical protein
MSSDTDALLTPPCSGASFGARKPITPLAEEITLALPSPRQAAAGIATSAIGNLLARLPAPWPIKALLIAGPLLLVLAEWFRRKGEPQGG